MAKGFILGQEPKIPEIDAYTKQETLTSDTVSMFGFQYPQIPDSIFSFIGKYNLYWWKRRTNTIVEGLELKSKLTENRVVFNSGANIHYSDNITYNSIGDASLGSPTYQYTLPTRQQATQVSNVNNTLRGKYFYSTNISEGGSSSTIFKFNSGNKIIWNIDGLGYYGIAKGNVNIQYYEYGKTGSIGEWEYIYSNNESAYPKSGIKDGYEYIFLGKPFDNMRQGINIEIGSWIGSGKNGQTNPNSITVSFPPKIISLFREDGNIINGILNSQHKSWVAISYIPAMSTSYVRESFCSSVDYSSSNIYYGYGKRSEDGKTITWYHESNSYLQWNSLGSKYYWVAIG